MRGYLCYCLLLQVRAIVLHNGPYAGYETGKLCSQQFTGTSVFSLVNLLHREHCDHTFRFRVDDIITHESLCLTFHKVF